MHFPIAFFFIVWAVGVQAQTPPSAAIASAHPLATEAGREIIAAGGNAFDAAVAVTAALAVVEPQSSGLGGGGFFLLHRARDRHEVMIDARERAPGAAQANMYLDQAGNPIPELSLRGPLAAAIPGLPAGLVHVAHRYGRLPLARSLAPAIRLARAGFPVSPRYRQFAEARHSALLAYPTTAKIFLDGGFVPEVGFVVHQPDLARTLERLAKLGRKGFYEGEVARNLVDGVRAAAGIWALSDLHDYQVREREPLRGSYRGVRVTTAPPPSSGGVALLQMLKLLQGYELPTATPVKRAHLIIEAMRRAYRDRALYLGDPDVIRLDLMRLLSDGYIARWRAGINLNRATPSGALEQASVKTGSDTTHLSIIDREGNRVAATLTINTPFGSAFVPPGTGVLLNNEMDDFVSKAGAPNFYGLVGGAKNAIAAGKRPLSSMTPTFLETPGAVVILGTPGGGRIISMVLLATLDVAHGRGDARTWVSRPRFHHQYLPDIVSHEANAFSVEDIAALTRMGHRLDGPHEPYGNMQTVVWYKKEGRVETASDPRGEGRGWVR